MGTTRRQFVGTTGRTVAAGALAAGCAARAEAHASVRLQSHCMVMGQGVGTCAALALAAGVDMRQVDVRTLQAQLRRDGAYIEDVPDGADPAE